MVKISRNASLVRKPEKRYKFQLITLGVAQAVEGGPRVIQPEGKLGI